MAGAGTPSNLQRRQTVAEKAAHGAADMTRRMICGGLAGMIAKVRVGERHFILIFSCAK